MSSAPSTANGAPRLNALAFEDIYMSEDGRVQFTGHDGVLRTAPSGHTGPLPLKEIADLLEKLKAAAKTRDEFAFVYDGVRYRAAVIRSQSETWYVMRRALKVVPSLDTFGGLEVFRDSLLNCGQYPGLIMATGPTGSGKTTFLSALLKTYLEHFGGVAVCLEDPPELALEGDYGKGRCFQLPVKRPEDYGPGLRRALRMRPRYILVGELRTQDAAMTAIRAGITGHTVLTTIHGGSVPQAILNLASMAAPHGRADAAWRGISECLNVVALLQRQATRPAPMAKFLVIPALNSVEGTRAKIRAGQTEHIQGDMDLLYARMATRAGESARLT